LFRGPRPRRAAFTLARRDYGAGPFAYGDLSDLAHGCGGYLHRQLRLRAPASIRQFADEVFTTPAGWKLIIVGTSVGFLFAVLTLTISAVSFPLLLDRDVGAAVALLTSIRVVAANPVTMGLWGLIVTALLVIGLVPFFLGLTVVFPVLGHATWHLYRKAVEPNPDPHPDYQPRQKNDRSAADFPAVLFPTRR
jgi:uncharacterized membrane protein